MLLFCRLKPQRSPFVFPPPLAPLVVPFVPNPELFYGVETRGDPVRRAQSAKGNLVGALEAVCGGLSHANSPLLSGLRRGGKVVREPRTV